MKPTNAWITYCTDPANAWLQELWEPAVGDWYTYGSHTRAWPIAFQDGLDIYNKPDREKENMVWLPTLSDLLGMILETAKPTNMGLEWDSGTWDGWFHIRELGVDVYKEGNEPEIAAAELLKRLKKSDTIN